MTSATQIDPVDMRQDPGFRLGYEFPELLDAIVELATPPSLTERIERIASKGAPHSDATQHAPQMLSFGIPLEEPLIDALIGVAREMDLKVNVRLYDRVEAAVYDLWNSSSPTDWLSLNLREAYAGRQVRGRDLYLDIAPGWTSPHRMLHILLG